MKSAEGSARRVRRASLVVARILPSVSPSLTAILCFLIILGAALSVAVMVVGGRLIGSIPPTLRQGLDSDAGRHTLKLVVIVSIIFGIQHVIGPLREAVAEALGRKTDGALRARVMDAVCKPVTIKHLEDPEYLDMVRTAQGVGLGHFPPGAAVLGLSNNISSMLRVLTSAVIVAIFSPILAVGLVASGVLIRSRLLTEGGRRVEVIMGQARSMRRSDYLRDLALTPPAAKELRIFGLEAWLLQRFGDTWDEVMSALWRQRKLGSAVPIMWFLPAALASGLGLFIVGSAAVNGQIDLARMALLVQAVVGAGTWFVTDNDLLLEHGASAIGPALELEAMQPESPPGTREPGEHPASEISFEDVRFTYPATTHEVLRGLSLKIPAGSSMAVVGSNGAGKTTFVKLLARLHDPTAGRIAVDGVDLREFDPQAWQRRVAAIFQDFIRYELPATDNVGFGAIERMSDVDSMREASTAAGATAIIDSLHNGWDTILSREYAEGADLSGGQWQRIAIARALFAARGQAGVLILDEPTANLDVRAEAELFDRFLDITRGSTTILVSHRFSTVRRADLICVLDEGCVAELGSHEELMALGGQYARMFNLQASRFSDDNE